MKTFTLILLLLSLQTAHALGPEEQEFVGKLKNNQLVTLSFKDDPNVYGSKIGALSHCKDEGEKITCSALGSGTAKLIYQRGTSQSKNAALARKFYRELYPNRKIGKWNPDGVYAGHFFECVSACSTSVPDFFILITHGD